MKALVTGAAGFVGRHVTAALAKQGWAVDAIDLPSHSQRPLPGVQRHYRGVGSLVDSGYFTAVHYDLAVHCAAFIGGRMTMEISPLEVLSRNLSIDGALFRWVARAQPERLIYISSSAVYPTSMQEAQWGMRLHEDFAPVYNPVAHIGPDISYGFEKMVGERLAEEYRAAGGRVTVVRPFSGYGEDQSLDYPFPSIIERVKSTPPNTGPIEVWSDATRDFIHIDDFVHSMLLMAEMEVDGPVNICTGRGVSMTELARMAYYAYWGADPEVKVLDGKPKGVAYRVGDDALYRTIYTPRIELEEGVHRALRA